MKRFVTMALLAGLAVLLGAGLYEVFRLRFEAGDVYPEYSTLRADPLGAKACFKILEEYGAHRVERNMKDIRLLKGREDTSILFTGVGSA